jgi:hypothetical protein
MNRWEKRFSVVWSWVKDRILGALLWIVFLTAFVAPLLGMIVFGEACFKIQPDYAITKLLLRYVLGYALPFAAFLGFLAGPDTERFFDGCLMAAIAVLVVALVAIACLVTGAVVAAFVRYVVGGSGTLAVWTGAGSALLIAIVGGVLARTLGVDAMLDYFSVAWHRGFKWAGAFAMVGVVAGLIWSKYSTGTFNGPMPLILRFGGGFAFSGLVVGTISGCRNKFYVLSQMAEEAQAEERRKFAQKHFSALTDSERRRWVHRLLGERLYEFWSGRH